MHLSVHKMFCSQQNSSWDGYSDSAKPLRVTDDLVDCTLRRWTIRRLTSWLSYRQRPPLLPRSRLALLERNRGSQHVSYARQSLQRWRTVALRLQSCSRLLGYVIEWVLVPIGCKLRGSIIQWLSWIFVYHSVFTWSMPPLGVTCYVSCISVTSNIYRALKHWE